MVFTVFITPFARALDVTLPKQGFCLAQVVLYDIYRNLNNYILVEMFCLKIPLDIEYHIINVCHPSLQVIHLISFQRSSHVFLDCTNCFKFLLLYFVNFKILNFNSFYFFYNCNLYFCNFIRRGPRGRLAFS